MRRNSVRTAAGAITVCALLLTSCSDDVPTSEPTTSASVVEDVNSVPDYDEIKVERIGYPTFDGSDPDQDYGDLYLPAGPQRPDSIPLVVLIHGGAWMSQLGADLFDPFARDLAARGLAVYNIEYRRVGSGGGWPTTFEDVSQALDNVVAIDQRFPQLEEEDALVVGHSAGAQLAVWGGTRHLLEHGDIGAHPKFRPTKVISLAGPLDMVQAVANGDNNIVRALGGTPNQIPDRYAAVDPIQNIDPGTPVIAMHGTNDTVVLPSLSQKYIDELEKQSGSGQVILLEGEDHTSIVNSTSPAYARILDTITDAAHTNSDQLAK
ncbi:alpha/beta hydrolase family protein [Williamsia sp.]|uniref:alpha/beta hydrolase family protein n=1 Tax=Williamsia sp. TaxID=1872085 RepID=UPI002F95418D